MDLQEILSLKKEVEKKYKILLDKLEEDKQKELGAIDTVYKIVEKKSKEIGAGEETGLVGRVMRRTKPVYGMLDKIRNSIISINEDFTVEYLEDYMIRSLGVKEVNRNTIHSVLRQMKEDKKVIVVEVGRGRTLAVYKYVGEQQE